MDVRCEKCQTEYELDEARLKPGGVTVKCTNCGHMFKIRKRSNTNVGAPPLPREAKDPARPRTGSSRPMRPDSMFDDVGPPVTDEDGEEAPTTIERQWLIRLENGEQKSCRELATLQQWIISGVVTREALISRTGKTWKRLGDIVDLGQYFVIADEARANRARNKPASRPGHGPGASHGTLPGYGAAQAAGGTILPDDGSDDDDEGPTRAIKPRGSAPTPPPIPQRGTARTPALGVTPGTPRTGAVAMSATVPSQAPPPAPRGPRTTPPPPPPVPRRPPQSGPVPTSHTPALPPPHDGRATAMWATDALKPSATTTGPFVGNLSAVPDEPAFAGRVRMAPGDEATFETGKVRQLDDDDDLLPARRGSRAGMLVLVMALLVMGAGAAVVYMFVIRKTADDQAAAPSKDAAVTAFAPPVDAAAAVVVAPAVDAAAGVGASLDAARGELAADVEPRLRAAIQSLEPAADPASQALRAHLIGQLAQDLLDRASVLADKSLADSLRAESRQLVLDAATAAQRALKVAGDDAGANLAMAEVLRLQGKPARDVSRYLDTARAKADKLWARDLALADGLVLARDGKLDDASAVFSSIDQGDGKLESSGDVRARFHLALALTALNKPADARPLVDAVLAAQPEHAGAKALVVKLETVVAKTDPLPPEEGTRPPAGTKPAPVATPSPATPAPRASADSGGGDSYDRVLARANAIADTSCARAMELYAKALEQKPNGVEALTGMGYCHIDAKQFASAFSKFRTALMVSPRYEPALRGIGEAYQQQGRKEQAIEAYHAYLEVYPDSPGVKKQLERLGDGASGGTPPAQPAPSTPTEAPDPGSGSN
jgi:predicted Zn finger-like uncharacterized protein